MRQKFHSSIPALWAAVLAPAWFLLTGVGPCEGTDEDGDDWTVEQGDCDDSDPSIHPDAAEVCNGIDDDCDDTVDEGIGTLTWYRDADDDGYGDPANHVQSCGVSGYVLDNSDCDDSAAAVNPGATELRNGIDDDCDGLVDEQGRQVTAE